MIFPKQLQLFDVLLWVIGFFPMPSEKRTKKHMNLQSTTQITKRNLTNSHVTLLTSYLSESQSHAPPVGLHGHQLQLFVPCLGCGSKSFNDQTRRHERHVHCNTATRNFSSQNDARQHGVFFLRVACHLQPFGLVKRMEEQQDRKEVHALEML